MRFVTLTLAALLCASCASRIEGETDKPPPPGGPKASAAHPPGESEAVLNQEKR